MSGLAVAAGGCVWAAVLLSGRSSGSRGRSFRTSPVSIRPDQDRAPLLRWRALLCSLAWAAGWSFVGGWVGAVAGLAGAALSWRALGRLEGPRARRRRELLERDLPSAVHLLGACLSAGAPLEGALVDVAAAMGGPVGEDLGGIVHRLRLGSDPVSVWRSVEGGLAPLGRCLARAHESGSSVRTAVAQLAEDLRAETRVRVQARARSVEVRASVPLGVCFLPAFVLLGVVPMVVGIFSSMKLFG
ncbi:MAG: Bacterial type secretion system protein domain protein [Marmoricola sp.]|nr:Bacterial type secretion system protein domain protein [Marmoricola sp.]